MVEGEREQDIDVIRRHIGSGAWRLHSGVLDRESKHWGILGARVTIYDLILFILGNFLRLLIVCSQTVSKDQRRQSG